MGNQNNSSIGYTEALILSSLFIVPSTGDLESYKPNLLPPIVHDEVRGTGSGIATDYPRYDFFQGTTSGVTEIQDDLVNLPLKKKVEFLLEILEDFTSFDLNASLEQDLTIVDNDVNENSLMEALKFLWDMPENFLIPSYDVHPDGHFSFVWRDALVGILSLSFEEDGGVNYASYFDKSKATHKGRIFLKSNEENTPKATSILYNLVEAFS